MKIKKFRPGTVYKLIFFLLFSGIVTVPAYSINSFDGEIAQHYQLPDNVFDPLELDLRVGQLVVISGLPHTSPLAEGIEITIDPPNTSRGGASAFALYIFQDVESRSGRQNVDELEVGAIGNLQGERIIFELLPPRSTFSIRIPARPSHSIRGGIDSRVTPVVQEEEAVLAIAVLPVMKGLPAEVLNAPFSVTTRPLLTNVGGLEISVVSHEGESLTAAELDEQDISIELDRYGPINPEETIYIRPGLYQVLINSRGILFDATQVGVEQGRKITPTITLPRPESRVDFQVPEFISVTIDGELLTASSITLPPGEYDVRLEFESYTKRYNLAIQAGRAYTFNVGLDVVLDSHEVRDLQNE
ncbi:MAG: hypothetical protein ACOCVC_00160 [Spirochaeta sp.]